MPKEHTGDEFGLNVPLVTTQGSGLGTMVTKGAKDETQVTDRDDPIPGQVAPWKFVVAMVAILLIGLAAAGLAFYLSRSYGLEVPTNVVVITTR